MQWLTSSEWDQSGSQIAVKKNPEVFPDIPSIEITEHEKILN